MMDSLLLKSPETLKRMPINKRAEEKVLDANLSIKDIAFLRYIDDKDKQKAIINGIIAECKAKKITYYGDINGWTWGGKYGENPHSDITNGKSNSREARPGDNYLRDVLNNDTSIYSPPEECLIHRDEFKRYLQSVSEWPIKDCLLSNWWVETRANTAPTNIRPIKGNPKTLGKLQKQQNAILEVIKNNGLDPMKIPDGKKTRVIQKDCENDYATIFNGSTSFDRAWDSGVGKLWQMEYHNSYARRGNN